MKKMKDRPLQDWPDESKDWPLERILKRRDEISSNPDMTASQRLYTVLNDLMRDPAIKVSPLFQRWIFHLQESAHDFAPGWELDDLLAYFYEVIMGQSTEDALKTKLEKIKADRQEVQRDWVSKDRGEGERARFAKAWEETFKKRNKGVLKYTENTIRKTWISKKSIAEFKKDFSGSAQTENT